MDETSEQTTPAQAGVTASAVRAAGARMSARFDSVDLVVLAGLTILVAGLWLWWSLGVALTVAGVVVLAIGLLGALPAKPAAPVEEPAARRTYGG